MKRLKKKILLFVALFSFQGILLAQSDVVEFIQAGRADATKLFEAYLNPYAQALGNGLNNGWYTSAATHKILGFDVSFSVSGIQIPSSDRSFDVEKLGLTKTTLASGENPLAPTVAGREERGPLMQVELDPGLAPLEFHLPQGTGYDFVPVPMAQLTVGVLPHTDVTLRYVPEQSFNDKEVTFDMMGFGIKHSFIKWIPGLKLLPFDASVYINYATLDAQSELQFTADDYDVNEDQDTYVHKDNQFLKIDTRTTSYGLVISKKLAMLTLFASAGGSSSKSEIGLKGDYPFVRVDENYETIIYGETDPLALKFKSGSMALSGGFRMKLAFFSFFGSVNRTEYISYNAGISLGFRQN